MGGLCGVVSLVWVVLDYVFVVVFVVLFVVVWLVVYVGFFWDLCVIFVVECGVGIVVVLDVVGGVGVGVGFWVDLCDGGVVVGCWVFYVDVVVVVFELDVGVFGIEGWIVGVGVCDVYV